MHAAYRPTNFTIRADQLIKLSDRAVLAKWRADFLYGHCHENSRVLTAELIRRNYKPDFKEVSKRLR